MKSLKKFLSTNTGVYILYLSSNNAYGINSKNLLNFGKNSGKSFGKSFGKNYEKNYKKVQKNVEIPFQKIVNFEKIECNMFF